MVSRFFCNLLQKNCDKLCKIPCDDVFKVYSNVSRQTVKSRIIKLNLFNNSCSSCSGTYWRSGTTSFKRVPLTLELEHKNGINNDNTLTNLEFLCCNCHSYTKTWRKPKFSKN